MTNGDHLSLGSVVQVLFDISQPGGRVVDGDGPRPFQFTNPL